MAGQIAGMIHEIKSCEELIGTIISETEQRIKAVQKGVVWDE